MDKNKSLRVYMITHADRRRTGILMRRRDPFFEKPAPMAYGKDEADVLQQLAVELLERTIEKEKLNNYLWDESFSVKRAEVSVHVQSTVKKQTVIGKKCIPLSICYVTCKLSSGAYRVMLPRFGWWMIVEDLKDAAQALKNDIGSALLGEKARRLYDFRREGEEYVKAWSPDDLQQFDIKDEDRFNDDADDFPVLNRVAEEWGDKAAHRNLPPVIGEWPERFHFEKLLMQYPPPSLLIVGGPGVGKTTLIRRLAFLSAQLRKTYGEENVPRIRQTSGDRIISGMIYLGMWQERCYKMIEELAHEGDYLYIDRISPFIKPQPGGASIAELFLPAMQNDEISLIAECSPAELAHCRQQFSSFVDQFEIIRVPETASSEMAVLLQQYMARKKPELVLHASAWRNLIQYLDAFQPGICFPGKGFRFMDQFIQQVSRQAGQGKHKTIFPVDIPKLYSQYTGLPVELIDDQVSLSVEKITRRLTQNIIGQANACEKSAQVIARFKARLHDPQKPIGTFLFVGPTGVGKTELAKQLTRFLYTDEKRLIRLDMSEFISGDSVSRLPAVGKNVNSLAEKIRQNPLSVVLFDEIEKAHPQVFDLLLGVLGEGRMSDSQGRHVDFRSTLIIMTSNLGASQPAALGFGSQSSDVFLKEVRNYFRPEFFNRMDHILAFNPLTPKDILHIVDLEIKKLIRREGFKRRSITLSVSKPARRKLADLGYHPTKGARPLKRIIEEKIITPISIRLTERPETKNIQFVICALNEKTIGKLTEERIEL